MTRVLVVYCHPNPQSFTAAARDRALAVLTRRGHDVRLTDLYTDGFEPAMSCDERRTHKEPGVAPELQRFCQQAADSPVARAEALRALEAVVGIERSR